jgi:hypothetical protein
MKAVTPDWMVDITDATPETVAKLAECLGRPPDAGIQRLAEIAARSARTKKLLEETDALLSDLGEARRPKRRRSHGRP